MKIKTTNRGFGRIEFKDGSGDDCSLQESSSVTPHIWLGIDNVRVIEYDGPPTAIDLSTLGTNVAALGRMHLTRAQVKALLPHLQKFVDTGSLS